MATEVDHLSNSVSRQLSNCEVDGDRGFLPTPDPLDRLPNDFSPWEEIGRELPKLLMTGKVRNFIKDMPLLDATRLCDDRERRRAMVILSFMGHAYVWGEKETVSSIPACLALPWHQLARMLGRMPEGCDPYVYFRRVRPYIHGWANHPSLPAGMIYEGVEDYAGIAQNFRGETGAQSSIIPALDAALGIVHAEDMLRRYLKEMRDYMPPRHRAFIEAVEAGRSVRDYVLCHQRPRLATAYNAAVDGIELFRSTHLKYARNYIVKQSQGGKRTRRTSAPAEPHLFPI